jgi:hypothetical protein
MRDEIVITLVGSVQGLESGAIHVRLDRVLRLGGHDTLISRRFYDLAPGDALDDQPIEVTTFAANYWTPKFLAGLDRAASAA